jgi:hypothetical protein
MAELFDDLSDANHLEFEKIEKPKFQRRDLCAFVKLNELVPGDDDIVSAAEHDEIWLAIDVEELAEVITEDDIIFLLRCGVMFDEGDDCLKMFV